MRKTDRYRDRESQDCELYATPRAIAKVCKTFIRRFDSDPRLQLESTNQSVEGSRELPADSLEQTNKHRSAQAGPSMGRTAGANGPTPYRWRRISSIRDAGDMPGVYVLMCRGRAVYVGQSLRLSERLGGHAWRLSLDGIRTAAAFYPNAYIKVKNYRRFGEWLMAEARLIRRLSPVENIRTFERAVNRPYPSPGPDGAITFDASMLFSGTDKAIPPVPELPPRPEGWTVAQCLCGGFHELSYESPRQDCRCGRWVEVVTSSRQALRNPAPSQCGGAR